MGRCAKKDDMTMTWLLLVALVPVLLCLAVIIAIAVFAAQLENDDWKL